MNDKHLTSHFELLGRISGGFAAAALFLSAMPVQAQQVADRPRLTVAVQELPDSLEPVMKTRTSAFQVVPSIFDFLIETDYSDNFDRKPGLATNWKRIDERTMEVDLRPGVVMHDGRVMTAEDVAFSFGPQRVSGEDAPAYGPSRAYLKTIERVEVVDEDTVRFVTSKPDPVLEARLSGWMSQVVSKKAFQEAESFSDWERAPVSTGPYKVQSFKTKDELVLAAHDDYWDGTPPYSTIRYVEVPEQSSRIAGLVAGDYDIITDIDPDQLELVESYGDLEVVGGDTIMTRSIRFSTNHPVLKDPRIRLALSLAIDRQAIVDSLWDGRVGLTNGFQFPYYGELYIEEHKGPGYDPDRARELMAEADYDGSPIPYRVLEHWYPVELPTSEAIAAMWEAVGFNIDMQVQASWDTILVENPAFIHNGATLMNIPDPVGGLWRVYGEGSSIDRRNQWRNEEFNKLGNVLETSLDPQARRDAFKRMLQIVDWEDVPATELHMRGAFYGKRAGIDWQPTPAPYLDFGPTDTGVN
ncbi:Heme-binding protein A (plasmid) [Nitratireductor thuwali]|uniref:Heme-binding protein A n=1 Tax=Nitratireductor thuwali TaxID=2267699 RepID=A0ABY5MNX4_9HYPH|nr:Heme-binding protein A [Nitratireductor thuwali]